MGQVVELGGRRPVAAKKDEPRYFCKRCDTDRFKILADRSINCAQCGARMRNLFVSDTSPSAA